MNLRPRRAHGSVPVKMKGHGESCSFETLHRQSCRRLLHHMHSKEGPVYPLNQPTRHQDAVPVAIRVLSEIGRHLHVALFKDTGVFGR